MALHWLDGNIYMIFINLSLNLKSFLILYKNRYYNDISFCRNINIKSLVFVEQSFKMWFYFTKILCNKRNSNRFVAGSTIVLALTKLIILDKNRSQYLLFVRSLTFNNGHSILMCTSVHSQKK